MSIASTASKEATKFASSVYISNNICETYDDEPRLLDDNEQAIAKQSYIIGRLAGHNKTEIEAGAKRLYEVTHAPEADRGWYAIDRNRRQTYRYWTEQILNAATTSLMKETSND
jgi:hypothetical protein